MGGFRELYIAVWKGAVPSEASKAPAPDLLEKKSVRRVGQSDRGAEIELPFWRDVEVERRNDLMLLLRAGIKLRHRPERPVVLDSDRDHARDVVARLEVRRELEAPAGVGAVDSLVDRRIEREIPAAELLVDDRTNLPRPR